MIGRSLGLESRTVSVLVYEYVTGGGLVGQDLPVSWAREGTAMRRAISEDFAALPGVRVIATVDARLAPEPPHPGVESRSMNQPGKEWLESMISEVDYTVMIAPEMDGILAGVEGLVERQGGRSLGSSRSAVELCGDKLALSLFFQDRKIATAETREIAHELPAGWTGPVVIKPRFGAGSVETRIIRDGRCPPEVPNGGARIAQPLMPGRPMSASFLVDDVREATFLGIGRQRIEVDPSGRISYGGGTILANIQNPPDEVTHAIRAVVDAGPGSGLKGFVGVDYLDDSSDGMIILEINPRPTTSYVGLHRLLGPGVVAGAWLDAMHGPLRSTRWPARIRAAREGSDLSFLADGTLLSSEA